MADHERFMRRCLELAARGAGEVAPNPMVGCVIVHNGVMVAEGWHRRYGEAHAEPMAISALGNDEWLKNCTLYVNLEPCAHWGKTPPCADLIVEKGIPRVVIGSRDPHDVVNGQGIEKLQKAGIEVITDVFQADCDDLNRRFLTRHRLHRPYVILKWAATADGYMAPPGGQRTQISGHAARLLLHKWRGEESAILVGTETVVRDQPLLDTRLYPGKNPLRVVLDPQLRAPALPGDQPVLVFNKLRSGTENNMQLVKLSEEDSITLILQELYHRDVLSLMVEGGRDTLLRWQNTDYFDEIRVIQSKSVVFGGGLPAPLPTLPLAESMDLPEDTIHIYRRLPA